MTDAPPTEPHDLPQRSEAEQRDFFEAVMQRALAAQASAGAISRDIEVAGVHVRLIFAGPRLADEFSGALAHLLVSKAEAPAATIHLWDSASTGVAMIPAPAPRSSLTDRGDIWGFGSRTYRSAFHWSEFSVCVFDASARVGAYWVQDTADLPYWAKSSPLRTHFHWLLEDYGLQLVHAAAIGVADLGAALITGKGGVGKSTTALSGLAAGMTYLGDDYVVVGLDPQPMVYSLYSTAKLEPRQAKLFPELAKLAGGPPPKEGEKAVMYLHPARADQIVPSAPLKWILTPRFGEAEATGFEPISDIDLHRAATFTTLAQLPHAGLKTHAFIGDLVRRTPRARLVLGRDVHAVPQAIAEQLKTDAQVLPAVAPQAVLPLVTVVVPVFNGAGFLRQAVESILAQDYPALEVIVVDDGSTDDIAAAVAALPIDVRFIRQANAGPAAARNRGIRDASGAFIAFLDVDDLWPEGNLRRLAQHLVDYPAVQVVHGFGQLARLEADGQHTYLGNPLESFPSYIGAGLYRREAFDAVGCFDEHMRFGEDSDWYNRAREADLTVTRLDETTLIVRRHENNMTRGKTMVELAVLRTFKKALDRKRAADSAAS